MIQYFSKLLDTSDYPPRWTCGNWTLFAGWLHIVSDVLIFLAYAAIPAALFTVLRTRKNTPFPKIGLLFVAFILSCGITHLIEAGIFWWPAYRLSGLMKALTAAVSLATAVAVIRALPAAISLPSVKGANIALQASLDREQALRKELTRAHEELEKRTSTLAVRDRRLRDALGAAKACAATWRVETGEIIWHLGLSEAMRSARIDWKPAFESWRSLVGEAGEAIIREASIEAFEERKVIHRRLDLVGYHGVWDIRMTASPEAPVAGQPATISGVFGLVPSGDSRPDSDTDDPFDATLAR